MSHNFTFVHFYGLTRDGWFSLNIAILLLSLKKDLLFRLHNLIM